MANQSHWVSDLSASECTGCAVPFTVFVRRHHCRACGGVFCSACSTQRSAVLRVGERDAVRVCDVCAELLAYATRIDDLLAAVASASGDVELTRMANRLEHFAARPEFHDRLLHCGGIDLLCQLAHHVSPLPATAAAIRCKVARALALLVARRPACRKAVFDRGVLDLLLRFFAATVALPVRDDAPPHAAAAPAPAPAPAAPPRSLQHAATSSAIERRRDKADKFERSSITSLSSLPAVLPPRVDTDDVETVLFLCEIVCALLAREDGIGAAAAERMAASRRLVVFVTALVLLPAEDARTLPAASAALEHMLRWRATRVVALEIGILRPLILIALEADDKVQMCAVQSFSYLIGIDAGWGGGDAGQEERAAREQARISQLAAGGCLLPLLELCRSASKPVRAAAVRIMARLSLGEHERLLLARHCLLDTLVPILTTDVANDAALLVLQVVSRIAGDVRCAAEARLGAADDGGIGVRLVRAVARCLARDSVVAIGAIGALQSMLLVDGDWSNARPTPLWTALRAAERRCVTDGLRVIVSAATERYEEGRGKADRDAGDKAFLAALEKM